MKIPIENRGVNLARSFQIAREGLERKKRGVNASFSEAAAS